MISDIEVKAEVFRVIRANLVRPAPSVIYGLVKDHLAGSGATKEQILKSLYELVDSNIVDRRA